MIQGIIGRKLGMTQIFRENGEAEAVTAIAAGPCVVIQIKKENKEGYNAAQLGFGEIKKVKPALKGHLKETGNYRHLREIRLVDIKGIKVGDSINVNLFESGDKVDITGMSKGKGFAGVVKRYNFAGGPKTHGQSDRHRAVGSIGASASPGRVLKGTKMPGHMGGEQVTTRRLEVVKVDGEKNIMLVKGAIPGAKNGLLIIRKSGK
ncbi:MAG: 50S ribosomal protein L3 [Dehalococcoidia bacterium]|nr:MAG: 50S ribosomal protein L3 [Dehalococcoidia bacterium]